MLAFVILFAFVWGIAVAVFMQFTTLGDFLSRRLTWLMTALGSGGDLLLLLLLLDERGAVLWWQVVAVFGVSSIGPSLRGMLQHQDYFKAVMANARQETMDGARDTTAE